MRVQKFEQAETTCCCCGLAPRRDALRRCTACRAQALEPTLTASGLAAKRRAECFRVNLSFTIYTYCGTMRLTAAAVVYEYVSSERYSPSAPLLISRPEPAPADCSLATERRATRRRCGGRDATSLSSCVSNQLIDRFCCCLP